jgi:GT2 family glycosyltransferase
LGDDLDIAVLVAVFNRVSVTLAGLTSLRRAVEGQSVARFHIFLLDDASPDGTAAAVRASFPDVHVLEGTGNLWWVRGMDAAYRAARAHGVSWDAYLLFNDDVVLNPEAFEAMLRGFAELNNEQPTALYGSMCTAEGKPSYPGRSINPRHRPGRPFSPRLLMETAPNGSFQPCDTFHANCLLVPASLMDELGGMNPAFLHRHGDTDLGFRLAKRGCRNLIMPGYVGICELNPPFPIAPTFASRIWQAFNPPNPIADELRLTFRYYPLHSAVGNMLVRFAYILRDAIKPRRTPMSKAAWQALRARQAPRPAR